MAVESSAVPNGFYDKLYLLQKRLKSERLFIRQDKEIIIKLNENVVDTCKNVYHLAWRTRQHWRNLDRLLSGARVFTSDCSKAAIRIEETKFEDASKHLGYQDMKYGEFLLNMKKNPKLLAIVLNCANKKGIDITNLSRLLLMCLYGSCLIKEDENYSLRLLQNLMHEQIIPCGDIIQYFFGPKSYSNAFLILLGQYSQLLFSSKLYLTAALHGAVMQIIVDDSMFLDLEMSKVLSRLSPKVIRDKFGEPGTPCSNRKMAEHIEMRQNCLINICNKFLRSLKDKIYCFPTGIKWILRELFSLIKRKTNNDEKKTTAIVGHVFMDFFICPAIINPEPYGVNSDAFVSETARYNLGQVASILRSLALAECGMKDVKIDKILHNFEKNVISSFVDAVLQDAGQLDPLNEREPVEGLNASAFMMTENELKSLIYFMKKMQTEDIDDVKSNGINQLIELLPPLPRRWTKPNLTLERNATSLPIAMQLKANPDLIHPGAVQRNGRGAKKTISLYSTGSLEKNTLEIMKEQKEDINQVENQNDKEEYENILADLSSMIRDDEVVLVISFGYNEDNQPGTLPEDKVLGLKDGQPHNTTFDIDATDEERQKRTSTIIQDAMKDLEGLKLFDTLNESSYQEGDSYENKTFDQSAFSSEFSTPDSTPKTTNLLIDFDDEEKTADKETSNDFDVWQSTSSNYSKQADNSIIDDPIESKNITENKVLLPISSDPAINQQTQHSFTDLDLPGNFNDANQNSAAFFSNKSATLGPLMSKPTTHYASPTTASLDRTTASNLSNQKTSTGSLLGSLNTILQQPAIPTPSSFTSTFEFDEEKMKSDGKPKRTNKAMQGAVINEEESNQFSDSSDSSTTEGARDNDNQTEQEDLERQDFEESAKRDQFITSPMTQDAKAEALKNLKKEIAENEKKDRRKSSSTWLKDKLATGKGKLKSVRNDLKNRTKSDGQHHHRKIQGQRVYRKMTAPQSQLKPNDDIQNEARAPSPSKSNEELSEEIMAKYRNILSNHGLMEDGTRDESFDLTDFPKETEFDDDFKFEDAKRKLRIVLCIADQSNFPSGAANCFQLLMAFLQAQLAEAINLQDRSVVAQLHETLRSIRQLPNGSCENLLDALEEDYRKRATYVSYLVRSKQGLLATLSHLEQVRKKVERDKAICSKYFTTVCVRLFLETPDKKREIALFATKFETTKMVDEKCALLEEFLENLYKEMSTDPTWVAAPHENWQDAKIATERTVLSKIYKAAFYPNGMQDIENDKIFHEHIRRLSKIITVNHKSLQIRKVFQKEAPWPSAQTELLMINAYKTPADKLRCIHRCCIAIMNLLSMATPNQTSGADEFVPVLVYVLIRANAPNLLSTKQYINNFYGNRRSGEEFYCWMQFCAAVEFVKSLDERGHN